jgi:hypothetical protein
MQDKGLQILALNNLNYHNNALRPAAESGDCNISNLQELLTHQFLCTIEAAGWRGRR